MSAMIARYLKDFGAPVFPAAEQPLSDDGPFGFPVSGEPEPAVDLDAERRTAYAEGHEAATAELTERHAAELEALAETHARAMAGIVERYETELAGLIADRIATVADEVSRCVTDATAQVLLPFLGELVARQAVADLAVLLKDAIEEGDAGRIKLRGPETLFRRLAGLMGEKAALLDFEESAEMDLTAEIGTAVLVTRLSAFAASLEKVME